MSSDGRRLHLTFSLPSRPRQHLSGFGALLALWVAACSPTSPTGLPQNPGFSAPFGALEAASDTRGCTFGVGYWKRQPDAWPARFDPNAIFHDTGKSWIDVLTSPPRGDVFYILAHQFIAAGLNLAQLRPELRPEEIGTPWTIVERDFFTVGAHSNFTRAEFIELALLFESFNEGKRGVAACG
jgi:hypothetical protein